MTSRTIPATARADIETAQPVYAYLAFLTIEHSALSVPVRVVSDVFDYVYGGNTYTGIIFGHRLLTDDENGPTTELWIQNTDRRIGAALDLVSGRARVSLSLLSTEDFDMTVEPRTEVGTASAVYGFADFELVDVTVNAQEIRGRIMLRDPSQEPWPGVFVTESRFPGAFR